MATPTHIKAQSDYIIKRCAEQKATATQLKQIQDLIGQYYLLTKQEANQSMGHATGGFWTSLFTLAAQRYIGFMSNIFTPIIAAGAFFLGAKATQWLWPSPGSLTGLVTACETSNDITATIKQMQIALESLKTNINRYEKSHSMQHADTSLALSGMKPGILLGVAAGINNFLGFWWTAAVFINKSKIGALPAVALGLAGTLNSLSGGWLASAVTLVGTYLMLPNKKTHQINTGHCLEGEMLIATTKTSPDDIPVLTANDAQSCVIVIIADHTKPANAAIAHINIDNEELVLDSLTKAINKLKNAGSKLENLQLKVFGGINIKNHPQSSVTIVDAIKKAAIERGIAAKNIIYDYHPSGKTSERTPRPDYYAVEVTYDRKTGKCQPEKHYDNMRLSRSYRYKQADESRISSLNRRIMISTASMFVKPSLPWRSRPMDILTTAATRPTAEPTVIKPL